MARMRHLSRQVRLGVCVVMLTLVLAGCDREEPNEGPYPVYVVSHSQDYLEISIGQDSLFENDYWEKILFGPDSVFLDTFPSGTSLWVWWAAVDALASDTLFLLPPAVVTISGNTTFLFEETGPGRTVMKVRH